MKKTTAKKTKTAAPAKGKSAPQKADAKQPVKANAPKSPKPKADDARGLLFRRFQTWKPGKLYTPDKTAASVPQPPPLVDHDDPKEAKRIRALLFKRFDLTPAPPEPKPAGAAPAKKPAKPPAPAAVQTAAADTAPSAPAKADDPAGKMMKLGILVLAILLLLVSGASRLNTQKFYLKASDGALEIWKGTFSPSGQKQMIILPGVALPEDTKAVYKEEDVYPLVYRFYLDKADTLLGVPGVPDLEGVKGYLHQAIAYATPGNPPVEANRRLNRINAMLLMLKADAAAARGTQQDLEEAAGLLKQASRIQLDPAEAAVIAEKTAAVETAVKALKNPEKKATPPVGAPETN